MLKHLVHSTNNSPFYPYCLCSIRALDYISNCLFRPLVFVMYYSNSDTVFFRQTANAGRTCSADCSHPSQRLPPTDNISMFGKKPVATPLDLANAVIHKETRIPHRRMKKLSFSSLPLHISKSREFLSQVLQHAFHQPSLRPSHPCGAHHSCPRCSNNRANHHCHPRPHQLNQ